MLWLGFQSGYIDGTHVEEDWCWAFRDVGLYSDHVNGCTDMTTLRLGKVTLLSRALSFGTKQSTESAVQIYENILMLVSLLCQVYNGMCVFHHQTGYLFSVSFKPQYPQKQT